MHKYGNGVSAHQKGKEKKEKKYAWLILEFRPVRPSSSYVCKKQAVFAMKLLLLLFYLNC